MDKINTKTNLTLSPAAFDLLKHFEGCELRAYDDARPKHELKTGDKIQGTITIGHGHTGKDVYIGQVITPDQAKTLLEKDVMWAQKDVNAYTTRQASQRQFDAMVCLTFNIGSSAFKNSTVLREFNKCNDSAAAEAFKLWHKTTIKGVKVASEGLVRRRFSESFLYQTGALNRNAQGWAEYYRAAKTKN